MRKIIYISLLIVEITVALALTFFPIPWTNALLIVSIVPGLTPLIIEGFSSLKARRMDLGFPVLITILILILIEQVKVAAFFVLLILLGQIFKEYILWRVRESIKSISKSLPDKAYIKKGQEVAEVKISDIKPGDTVAIKPGGRVPVDGTLLTDKASFDESVISGESKPVSKVAGNKLVAGAINLNDYVEMTAVDTSENSTISQIHKLVEEAQSKNAPLSHFSNRYAEVTSIVALVLVILVFIFSHNIIRALALWVALVPVIFAVIVPVATTIGISLLAKRGILVKHAEALENLTKLDTIVFDKTGTLTRGTPELNDIIVFPDFDQQQLLQLAASVEKYSEHHLAQPIIRRAEEEHLEFLPMQDARISKGKGISGYYEQKEILIGNQEFLKESGITLPDDILEVIREKEELGNSAIFAALDKRPMGVFLIGDKLRDEAEPALRRLKETGFKLVMLTGDSQAVADKTAQELGGIIEVRAKLLPPDKKDLIREFKNRGGKVLMLGDGINDAPALAEANVGMAMGLKGVDITLESAQVVLINDDLAVLPGIIASSRRIFRIIKNNLYIATAIHILTAGLVMINVIGILGSAALHQVSSSLVLLNTLRLFSIKEQK